LRALQVPVSSLEAGDLYAFTHIRESNEVWQSARNADGLRYAPQDVGGRDQQSHVRRGDSLNAARRLESALHLFDIAASCGRELSRHIV
jgi:hypothetical protein